jgi:hypothetical protein
MNAEFAPMESPHCGALPRRDSMGKDFGFKGKGKIWVLVTGHLMIYGKLQRLDGCSKWNISLRSVSTQKLRRKLFKGTVGNFFFSPFQYLFSQI